MKRTLKVVSIVISIISAAFFSSGIAPVSAEMDEGMRETFSLNEIYHFDPTTVVCEPSSATPISPGGNVSRDFSIGNGEEERAVNLARNLMGDLGITAEQASGIVGNFMREAGVELPPNINQGGAKGPPTQNFSGGNAYGWAQWDGPRKRAMLRYAVDQNLVDSMTSEGTDASNYAYLLHELNSSERASIVALKQTITPGEAAAIFEEKFERAGVVALPEREASANQVFEWLGGVVSGFGGTPSCNSTGQVQSVEFGTVAFPLGGGRAAVKNPEMFNNSNTDQGGHPYTAYDILADPGVPVRAFTDGIVTSVGRDRCPGLSIQIYNSEYDVVVSYLHLSIGDPSHVQEGDTIRVGQQVGVVGSVSEGCGTPHLHIDVVKGRQRVGCSRLQCSSQNKAQFVDIGKDLYRTFNELPEEGEEE